MGLGGGRGLHVFVGAICYIGGSLCLLRVLWAFARLVHLHEALRVSVDAKAELVIVKIIYRIEVAQEDIADEEQVCVVARQLALVNHKVAVGVAALVQVELWRQFKDIITELETDGLQLWSDRSAALRHKAAGRVRHAVEVGQDSLPFLPEVLEDGWRD